MHWVVQENIREEAGYEAFLAALHKHNIEHTIVKVVPFSYETIPDVNPEGPVLVWGSVSLDSVAKKKGWTPGTFLNENSDQRIWTEAYGRENMLNSDVEYYEFCSIPKYEGTRFIRPVDDKKRFNGMVVHTEEIEDWKQKVQALAGDGYSRIRPDTMCGVSSVREIAMEWRFFVVDGRVVTGSRYRQWGMLDQRRVESDNTGPLPFAQKMVDKWQPARAFVLDVASVVDEPTQYKVIEVNCINSSGFYASDLDAVVSAVDKLTL